MEYVFIETWDKARFNEEVNYHLSKGFRLLGVTKFMYFPEKERRIYTQTMVKG